MHSHWIRWIWWLFVTLLLAPVYMLFLFTAVLLAVLPITPTRIAQRNLYERLGCRGASRFATVVGVYLNYAFYGLEVLVYWPLGAVIDLNENAYFEFLDWVCKAYDLSNRQRGILFLGGHFSAIEQAGGVTNRYLISRGRPSLAVLAKPAPIRFFTWLMDCYRKLRSLEVIWTGGRSAFLGELARILQVGHSIGMIVDQKPSRGGIFIQFFGVYASFPFRGMAHALACDVPVVATNARRIMPGVFFVEYVVIPTQRLAPTDPSALQVALQRNSLAYDPAPVFSETDGLEKAATRSQDVEVAQILSHFAGWLEVLVRKSPYQWCWDYRKWSRNTPGDNKKEEPGPSSSSQL